MNFLFSFFRNASEKRTQFFIVLGFIIFPLVAMIYVFVFVVMDDSVYSSERLKIPQEILETQQP